MNKNIISYASALVVAVLIARLILAGQASPKKTDTSEPVWKFGLLLLAP